MDPIAAELLALRPGLDARAAAWVARVGELTVGLDELTARWGTLNTEERRVHARLTALLGRVAPDLAALCGDLGGTGFDEALDEASDLWLYYMQTAEMAGLGSRA